MIQGNSLIPDYSSVPSVVFTYPLLAAVGLRVKQAVERGIEVVVHARETPDWYSSQ